MEEGAGCYVVAIWVTNRQKSTPIIAFLEPWGREQRLMPGEATLIVGRAPAHLEEPYSLEMEDGYLKVWWEGGDADLYECRADAEAEITEAEMQRVALAAFDRKARWLEQQRESL